MSNINIISCLKDIQTIYPQAVYETKYSQIKIPILRTEAFLNDDIYITVTDVSIRCKAGLEEVYYYFEKSDTNSDVIKHINQMYSFIEKIFEIIKEEIEDKI